MEKLIVSKKQDFTLVELVIVVVCFIGLVVVFNGCGKDSGSSSGSSGSSGKGANGAPKNVIAALDDAAHRANCKGNLNQIGMALLMYSNENDGKYPSGPAMAADVRLTDADFYTANGRAGGFELLRTNGYLNDYAVYVCPSTNVNAGKGTQSLSWSNAGSGSGKANCSYAYQPGLVDGCNTTTGLAGSGICADLTGDGADVNGGAANHTKFGNILFLDGHVKGFEGLGWFSPENVGHPKHREAGTTRAMVPNTLRDPQTGAAL